MAPFLLQPIGKDYLWGGSRLCDDFTKSIEMYPLAETWECSTHPDGTNIVASGIHKGRSLMEVLKENPSYLGGYANSKGELPILIKLIDAKRDLSVQVHPDDAYARQHEHGSMGKTEMWYVLDAARDTTLVYGFHQDMEKQQLRNSLLQGTVEKYLRKVAVHKDDVFYIEAGQVHAIGAGAVIAEIQENSNLTYRLFDYNRVDKNGKKRELHIEKALDVVRLTGSEEPRQPMRILRFRRGFASELLCRCAYFQVERMILNTEICRDLAEFRSVNNSFQVLLCIEGCGVLLDSSKDALQFFKGDCIFVPAGAQTIRLHGKATLLKIGC